MDARNTLLLMIYEINHIWTAKMKWKWRNDRRSERNLCNCHELRKEAWKILGLQRGLNPRPRDIGAMLYQLSYEATDVGSRSIVGSYVPVKEMSVNDIWSPEFFSGFFTQVHKLRSLRRSFLHFQIPYSHLISRVLNFAIFTSFAIWEKSRNLILAKSKNTWKSRNEILAKSENRYTFKSINLVSRRGSLAV